MWRERNMEFKKYMLTDGERKNIDKNRLKRKDKEEGEGKEIWT